jgi:hypothetical protein
MMKMIGSVNIMRLSTVVGSREERGTLRWVINLPPFASADLY